MSIEARGTGLPAAGTNALAGDKLALLNPTERIAILLTRPPG